ncbi:MAG: hypothetical protein ABIO43_11350 [Sphingomicrobium sp.]
MTAVGAMGILICMLAYPFAVRRHGGLRLAVFSGLLLAHLATAIFYYVWQQTNTSDAPLYYYDQYGFYGRGFGFSTIFVIYFVQYLRDLIGGTYLDYFLLFQATGFWAVIFMMRMFEEIYEDLGVHQPLWTYAILFLPSLHFWTSPIGKDGPLVLAAAMAAWGTINITRRWPILAFAFIVMVCFRPHIALIGLSSLAFALVLDKRNSMRVRVALIATVVFGLAAVAGTLRSTFSVDVTSAGSVSDFFATQAQTAQLFDTGSAVLNASFPVRLVSLLVRPFFLDAGSALGLLASFENLLVATMLITFVAKFKLFRDSFQRVLFFRYAAIFSAIVLLLLAMVYYNVGLGLRQRTMAFPTLLVMFVTMWALLAKMRPTLISAPA